MSGSSDSLVIFLHGVGASGADLAPLAEPLSAFLPSTVFAAPNAPERFNGGGAGRQWFSIAGVSADNRQQRIEQAREAFDRAVSATLAERGFAGRLDRVALFGFSQGAMMALDAVASGRWPVAAVVASSGRLAGAADPLPAAATTPVMLLHGEADAMVPAEESRRAATRLKAAGFTVEARFFARLGHALSAEGVEAAGAFLASALKPA
ncbi:MAG: prolyl oligopeptidase family serine peptidase [Roseiarcus sp.]